VSTNVDFSAVFPQLVHTPRCQTLDPNKSRFPSRHPLNAAICPPSASTCCRCRASHRSTQTPFDYNEIHHINISGGYK
jgi:hypothetical protein